MKFVVGALEREIAMSYKDLWPDVPFNSLCAYITLFSCGFSGLTDMIRHSSCFKSVSNLVRALAKISPESLKRSMRRMRSRILKKISKNQEDWVFATDTTDNPKRTKGLIGRGKWAKSNGAIFEGRNLVVLVAINIKSGYAVPLVWFPCIKRKDDPVNGKTAWELVLDALAVVITEGFPKLTLVTDSWFDGVPFMKLLESLGFTFVIELKSCRKAAINGDNEFRKIAENFNKDKKEAVYGATKVPDTIPNGLNGKKFAVQKELILRATRKQGQKEQERETINLTVGAVYNYQNSLTPFAFYGTNSPDKSSAWLWLMSRCRWNIEVMFKDLKQYLSWGKGCQKSQLSCDIAIVIPFLIITHLRLNDLNEEQSISTILEKNSLTELGRNINFLLKNLKHSKIKLFFNRINPDFANKKPRDSVVEGGADKLRALYA